MVAGWAVTLHSIFKRVGPDQNPRQGNHRSSPARRAFTAFLNVSDPWVVSLIRIFGIGTAFTAFFKRV